MYVFVVDGAFERSSLTTVDNPGGAVVLGFNMSVDWSTRLERWKGREGRFVYQFTNSVGRGSRYRTSDVAAGNVAAIDLQPDSAADVLELAEVIVKYLVWHSRPHPLQRIIAVGDAAEASAIREFIYAIKRNVRTQIQGLQYQALVSDHRPSISLEAIAELVLEYALLSHLLGNLERFVSLRRWLAYLAANHHSDSAYIRCIAASRRLWRKISGDGKRPIGLRRGLEVVTNEIRAATGARRSFEDGLVAAVDIVGLRADLVNEEFSNYFASRDIPLLDTQRLPIIRQRGVDEVNHRINITWALLGAFFGLLSVNWETIVSIFSILSTR